MLLLKAICFRLGTHEEPSSSVLPVLSYGVEAVKRWKPLLASADPGAPTRLRCQPCFSGQSSQLSTLYLNAKKNIPMKNKVLASFRVRNTRMNFSIATTEPFVVYFTIPLCLDTHLPTNSFFSTQTCRRQDGHHWYPKV